MAKTAFQRDKDRGYSRLMVRLSKEDRALIAEARTVGGAYAPTASALIRRGLQLAVEEIKRNSGDFCRSPFGRFVNDKLKG
jgi:hypothetical protein